MTIAENLWPELTGVKSVPKPVQLLREQGVALSQQTNGKLYGEVLRVENAPGSTGNSYDFYIGVTERAYRFHLLSIECETVLDYPVILRNTIASTMQRVGETAFRETIRLILNSPATKDLLTRMISFANQ